MNFSEFRASKAFKGTFDEVVHVSKDLEQSMGSKFTASAFADLAKKDTTITTRLRSALETFVAEGVKEGKTARAAKGEFLSNFGSELATNSRGSSDQAKAFRDALNIIASPNEATAPLAPAARVERVAQPTGVIDGLIRNPEKLAKVGGPSVTQALRDYEGVLEGLVKRVNRDGVKDLSPQERVAIRAVSSAFEKDSTDAGRGITAAQARENLLDALDIQKGTKTRKEMSELLGKPAEGGGGNKPPVRREPTMDPVEPAPKKAADEAIDAADKPMSKRASEAIISNSLLDMATVRTTNGKMPKQAFFSELQNALRDAGLLSVTRSVAGKGNELATTPAAVYERIARRAPIAESEMQVLSTYFGRYHNDAKAAKEVAANPPALMPVGGRGIAGAADALIRRIPISEGVGRATPTAAQAHAWETAETSFARNRVSAFQERPVRNVVGALALAGTGLIAQQTISTLYDFENPNLIGREVIAAFTPSKLDHVHDYIEFANGRYLGNIPLAEKRLKEIYGIESLSTDEDKEKAVDAIIRGPLPRSVLLKDQKPVSPDVIRALTMYVAQAAYGKDIVEANELKEIRNQSILKDADKESAKRTKTAQSAVTSMSPVPMMDIAGIESSNATVQPAYAQYQVDGETFDNRLKGISYNNPTLYKALADAFKVATTMTVKPDEELTSVNKLSQGEASLFAAEAKKILAAQKVEPERAEKIVELLVQPVTSEQAPAPAR